MLVKNDFMDNMTQSNMHYVYLAQGHASKYNEDGHFCLNLFTGDLGELLRTASDQGNLTDALVALAPSGFLCLYDFFLNDIKHIF